MMPSVLRVAVAVIPTAVPASIALIAAGSRARRPESLPLAPYVWTQRVAAAPYPGSYNYPVFMVRGSAWALHPQGAWRSADGTTWTRTSLPASGLNTGNQKYLQLGDAVYALGAMTGNYQQFTFNSRIRRTTDLERWEIVADTSNLPRRVFYGAATFNNRMWLMGGYDGSRYYNDVWSSPDGARWTRVLEHAPWTPRNGGTLVPFQGRLWMIGGGIIDGDRNDPNPNSEREIWSTTDGNTWTRHADRTGALFGGTPVVYDGRLWLVGANRRGAFDPAMVSTSDMRTWQTDTAPWSPRGAPAAWVMNDQLFMTGGKYSEGTGQAIRFIYRNDVWSMTRAR